MPPQQEFILGETCCTLDGRYRVSIPAEHIELLDADSAQYILSKERPGCLSLWSAAAWKSHREDRVELIKHKMRLHELQGKTGQLQLLGRLLSTGHASVQLAGRGRLLIPKEFRDFFGVEPNGQIMVVGAALCVEIWSLPAWSQYLERQMPKFQRLLDHLSRAG
jgi:MraZ protein